MATPPAPGLATLGLLDATVHAFAAALQGVVTAGVEVPLPPPSNSAPSGRVAVLSLLHLCFTCVVAGYSYLPTIWEEVACAKGRMEGISTLNQNLSRGTPSCRRVFGGRAHFSTSLPLLDFVNNAYLLNPSLDPACSGGGFTPWMTRQGMVEASTREGADASLLAQQLDGRLALVESLRTAS